MRIRVGESTVKRALPSMTVLLVCACATLMDTEARRASPSSRTSTRLMWVIFLANIFSPFLLVKKHAEIAATKQKIDQFGCTKLKAPPFQMGRMGQRAELAAPSDVPDF